MTALVRVPRYPFPVPVPYEEKIRRCSYAG